MYFNFDKDEDQVFYVRPKKRRPYTSITLRLTSMIDMFTILLFFLLQSFSAEGELLTVSRDLKLPESTAKTPPRPAPILVVTNEWIILDGAPIETIAAVRTQPNIGIDKLSRQLRQIRQFSENLGKLDPKMGFKGAIIIQGDREIPFEILKKIMFTCGQVGFNNMMLAVNQQDKV
jgi:biopolymer transport protein ExbD